MKLWRTYLVYAQLFGIADKVAENFRKLYPDDFKRYVEQIGVRDAFTLTSVLSSTQNTARTMLSYAASAKRAASLNASSGGHSSGGWSRSGGGGWSSHSGGGGYSGGGHGGGSR